ncbi:hypothetical protein ABVK25_007376 [Lepraria finkii]|uniref:G-patch domain-containing protein n=1 Tax=Lepraria finkii TaxID=1340010 RepID=A0ABR4B4H9_9LECA
MANLTIKTPLSAPKPAPDDEEEDDYMSMAIHEPTGPLEKETYTARRIRIQRESEARSRPKSKSELAAAADLARDSALLTALPSTSKGFQMMAKLGFKSGNALGSSTNTHARTEPLEVVVKEDRGGVGMENEKREKFREEAAAVEGMEKRQKAEVGDYRERVGREREEKGGGAGLGGYEGVWKGWRRRGRGGEGAEWEGECAVEGLVREGGREERERERRARYDLLQSLSKNASYAEEDEQDRLALGREEEDMEEEDEELDAFMALEGKERLRRLVGYLREKHFYCFWCKSKYEDESMDGCPGVEEDDHD